MNVKELIKRLQELNAEDVRKIVIEDDNLREFKIDTIELEGQIGVIKITHK